MVLFSYGDRLSWALDRAGITDVQLGAAMGISRQATRKVVEGLTKSFSAANNVRAARILGVNSEWLATGDGSACDAIDVAPPATSWPLPSVPPQVFARLDDASAAKIDAYAAGIAAGLARTTSSAA